MLLGKLPLASPEKLACPSAFAAERTSSNLSYISSMELPALDPNWEHTSVQAACRKLSVQLTLNLRWS